MNSVMEDLSIWKMSEYGRSEERARLRSGYLRRFNTGEENRNKQPHRDRVCDFICRNHNNHKELHLLSTPGEKWHFEHQLSEAWSRGCRFTGMEWVWGVLEKSVPFMPGRSPQWFDYSIACGVVTGVRTTVATHIYVHAGWFLTLTQQDKHGKIGSRSQKRLVVKRFASRFKNHTCAWLDLNTNWSPELYRCLLGIGSHFQKQLHAVPLALTFVAAQDSHELPPGSPIDRRCIAVRKAIEERGLRRCEIADAWMYRSTQGQSMISILCILRNV